MRVLTAATAAGPLTLEPLAQAHAAGMYALLSDPALYEFGQAPPASAGQLAERYARLEARHSPDGVELWLNWVLRLADGRLAGYVQATILPSDVCFVAYLVGRAHWRQGLARAAVGAMLAELAAAYDVERFAAVLEAANYRSRGLLESLGFTPAAADEARLYAGAADALVMVRAAAV